MKAPRIIPGLKEEEASLMRQYIETLDEKHVQHIEFNVRLGEGRTIRGQPEEIARMAKMITQLRADAIIEYEHVVQIVETKVNAGPEAIGQLMTYKDLYMISRGKPTTPDLILVCRELHPDVQATADLRDIKVIVMKA